MAEKTYVADVAFESIRRGQVITSEETERLAALLGAGYIHEMNGPVYVAHADDYQAEDDTDEELLEHFEEQDVVEKPKRGRPRKEQ